MAQTLGDFIGCDVDCSSMLDCSSHMELEDDDPSFGRNFSIETLTRGPNALNSIPSTAHGAPVSAQVQQNLIASLSCLV